MTDTAPPPPQPLQGDTPVDQVLATVLKLAQPLANGPEARVQLPLPQTLGRVLAQDVVSPLNVPPHDNAAMDGYAFAGSQLAPGQPLTLRVIGTALAGQPWQGAQARLGECVKIMTGAVMPAGLDTVVPQELTRVQGSAVTVPAGAVRPGEHCRLKGEDLALGQPALLRGERLGPAALGLLASLGLAEVPVWRRLRVAYFSTGDEILSINEPPREGAVYDSNRFTVTSLLAQLGCEVVDLGLVRDDPAALEAAFRAAASQADAIITSGGVSMGDADHTRSLMQQLGEVAFWRVAMRPGRPLAVGRIRRSGGANQATDQASALLFGLPGNPVAAMVAFLVFVRPALLRMMGARHVAPPPLLRARSEQALRKRPGRTEYQRGIVTQHADGSLSVRSTGQQGSGMLSSMVRANGLIVLGHGQGHVAPGDEVQVMLLDGVMGG